MIFQTLHKYNYAVLQGITSKHWYTTKLYAKYTSMLDIFTCTANFSEFPLMKLPWRPRFQMIWSHVLLETIQILSLFLPIMTEWKAYTCKSGQVTVTHQVQVLAMHVTYDVIRHECRKLTKVGHHMRYQLCYTNNDMTYV